MPISEAITVASLTRLLQPIVKDLYDMAKKVGVLGLKRWEARAFAGKLAKRIKEIDQVRTIWKPESPISLQDFFHPPKINIDGRPTRIARISELPSNAVVIEGIVGQGKSVFLRSLAIEELVHNDGKWLPMFVELKNLTQKIGLSTALHRQLDAYDIDIDDGTIDYLFRSGKFALLLDGFDELEDGLVKDTYIEIEHLALKYPELKIVVTSRPSHEILKSTLFHKLPIAPLRPAEYASFLDRLKVDGRKSLEIRQAIKNSPSNISDLITTPLMLTLVVMVYESESQIPETLPEFFDSLFQVVFTKHDRQKANFNRKHKSGLSERRLQGLFEAFSFMTIQSGYKRTLSDTEFSECFEMSIAFGEGVTCEIDGFRHDITKSACLMLEDGVDSITYLHKSILEYYAAAFVKRLSEDNAKLFYEAALNNSKPWRECLIFLKSIDSVRYSKYYALPIIERDIREILDPATLLSDENLFSHLTLVYPDLCIYYAKGENGKYQHAGIGGFSTRSGEEIGGLWMLLMGSLLSIAPDEVSSLRDSFAMVYLDVERAGEVRIPAERIFSEIGMQEPRKCLDIFRERLRVAKENAEKCIHGEEKKRLLFVRRDG